MKIVALNSIQWCKTPGATAADPATGTLVITKRAVIELVKPHTIVDIPDSIAVDLIKRGAAVEATPLHLKAEELGLPVSALGAEPSPQSGAVTETGGATASSGPTVTENGVAPQVSSALNGPQMDGTAVRQPTRRFA